MDRERKPGEATSSGHVCRSCKQPVDTVVKRHKNMGVYVPIWIAGPCHNPECRQYEPEQERIHAVRDATRRNPAGWEREESPPSGTERKTERQI
ncbi:hypothetical protein [Streptomyces hawaiiensis]|jgi:hypothetical protein|uniref:Uncharacterized protein n=1 Tax=Streptomyces hawaiiensis TaxID=67305 RepID=A0A6G5R7A7_9ACTN|nr:hypothetical protein [Streptomyces hawaiiensis]QCD53764.1 hypothetical protein CEB94_01865 [Streptomyces hawaiiensis]